MTQSGQFLVKILKDAQEISKKNMQSLAVFDLDSTLFDVSPRLLKIIHDFAELPSTLERFPEAAKILKTVQTQRSDWGIKQALIRAGLDHQHPEFHEHIRNYWEQSFFSNHYLQFDQPFEGAVEFVNEIKNAGARIVYLTGRDIERMGEGSVQTLHQWGFPILDPQAELVLKPKKGMDDARFKSDWFLQTKDFTKVWFFENEPVNIHLVRKEHPEVEILFFHSTHSGKAEIPMDLPHLVDFLIRKGGE